ncbi:MAG: hypothetical protein M3680_31750 [Myxococcota bacterium]|nr:hypothetical protein [Myxococcota bacterium]
MQVRTISMLLACLVPAMGPAVARAQPSDPYGQRRPPPPPSIAVPDPAQLPASRPGEDPVLAEQISRQLVGRAQELFDARVYIDAKQLAVEALVRSPRGEAALQARVLIKAINQQLGISDEPAPVVTPVPPVDVTPTRPPIEAPARERSAEAGGSLRTRTIMSGVLWGGVIGGLIADAVDTKHTTAGDILLGAAIGGGIGGITASMIAKRQYTRGDLALVDTFAGIGAVGGLTMGMLMQPVESEAYSVNAVIGTMSGLLVGYIAAPQTNTTSRRMLRIAGFAAAGGALPFLLYAGIRDGSSDADERLTGALATGGLVVGTYLGFRLTRQLDLGKDVRPGEAAAPQDAPLALVGRHSDGRWTAGSVAIQPLSAKLAPQPGMVVPIVGATF